MNFTLPTDQKIKPEILTRLKELPAINIYRSLADMPTIFNPWIDMVQGIYALDVDVRLREIAILRQAFHAQAKYELHQHHLVALANGLTEGEIHFILSPGPVHQLDAKENLLCQVVDELGIQHSLSAELRGEFIKAFGAQTAQELITVISFYTAVGVYLNAMDVPIEHDNPLAGKASPTPK